MEKILFYLIPVLAFALLAAGWMAVQLLARKVGTKNHLEDGGGCCGACEKRDRCAKNEHAHTILKTNEP